MAFRMPACTAWPRISRPASCADAAIARRLLDEQRLAAVPPRLESQLDTIVKKEIPLRVGEAERIELRGPDFVQLEVQDVSAAHAKVVRMDFAGWVKSDLQWPAMDRSGADLLQIVALDHDREVRFAVLVAPAMTVGGCAVRANLTFGTARVIMFGWMDAERRNVGPVRVRSGGVEPGIMRTVCGSSLGPPRPNNKPLATWPLPYGL